MMDDAEGIFSIYETTPIEDIQDKMPKNIQNALISENMSNDILNFIRKYMKAPKSIIVKSEELTLAGIRHF